MAKSQPQVNEAEYVVVACGVWSPRIAEMAGATIPLTPAVHQMIDVGPIPILEATGKDAVLALSTSNGGVGFQGSLAAGDHSVRTNNGSIDVALPANAKITALVCSGRRRPNCR